MLKTYLALAALALSLLSVFLLLNRDGQSSADINPANQNTATEVGESVRVCAIEKNGKDKVLTANVERDRGKDVTNIDSVLLVSKNINEAVKNRPVNSSDPVEGFRSAAVVSKVSAALFAKLVNTVFMYTCTSSELCSLKTIGNASLETVLNPDGSYERKVSENGQLLYVINGTVGDSGNLDVTSTKDNATYTWSRDDSGNERLTITGEDSKLDMFEDKYCNGEIFSQDKNLDGETETMTVKWTTSGQVTSGSLVARSTGKLLNYDLAW